jgi:nucleoside 2-deoxyribosyltransferase
MSKKVYLAVPFSGIEPMSYAWVNEAASFLIGQGLFVFSPISHGYPISKAGVMGHSQDTWMALDEQFVNWADELYVLVLAGDGTAAWGYDKIKNSSGVQQEISWAKAQNKPITYVLYNSKSRTLEVLPAPDDSLVIAPAATSASTTQTSTTTS